MMNTVRSFMSSQNISTAYRSIFKTQPLQGYKTKSGKDFESASNNHVQYGCASVKGYRPTMEDEYNAIIEVPSEVHNTFDYKHDNAPLMYFAVYDGHGGSSVSKKLSEDLYVHIMTDEISRRKTESNSACSPGSRTKSYQWLQEDSFLKQKFMSFDKQLKSHTACGSTAATVFVSRDPLNKSWEVICANTGDSSAVLFDQGVTISLNKRHDVNILTEKQRVVKASCEIYDDYVFSSCGQMSLAMTRAFGDYLFKNNRAQNDANQAVIAEPDIVRVILHDDSKRQDLIKRESKFDNIVKTDSQSPYTFLVVGCDGIWDVMSYRSVTKYVNEKLLQQDSEIQQGKRTRLDITSICRDLTKKCYHSRDNITVIIALLNRGSDNVDNMGPA
ncbi:protein phosphatase 1B [Acrasis kona]|uniref:protein-serine/threonine phosphatase n=1 Tax=Acrasis kona TaxID=1008807 RepID=A0AAW2YKM5_9EUKA